MAAEDEYVAAERPYAFADLTVDGATEPPAPGEYVELARLSAPR